MKTLKITVAISFILFFAGLISSSAIPLSSLSNGKPTHAIIYKVNVHISTDIDLCNMYQIVLVDGTGRMIAPPKGFIPGTATYTFSESGPVSGERIALMILNTQTKHYICPNELKTAPDVIKGDFNPGKEYNFNLFPVLNSDPRQVVNDPPKE